MSTTATSSVSGGGAGSRTCAGDSVILVAQISPGDMCTASRTPPPGQRAGSATRPSATACGAHKITSLAGSPAPECSTASPSQSSRTQSRRIPGWTGQVAATIPISLRRTGTVSTHQHRPRRSPPSRRSSTATRTPRRDSARFASCTTTLPSVQVPESRTTRPRIRLATYAGRTLRRLAGGRLCRAGPGRSARTRRGWVRCRADWRPPRPGGSGWDCRRHGSAPTVGAVRLIFRRGCH